MLSCGSTVGHRGSVNRHRVTDHKTGKTGILRVFSVHGKLIEFYATSGKICNKQSIFSLSFKYLCKTAVDWVNRIIMTLDEGHYYIYFFL